MSTQFTATKLRHRVELQKPLITHSHGEESISWTKADDIRASIEPFQGREYFAAGELQAELKARIRVRFRADIAPNWRLVHGNDNYDIIEVIDPGARQRELELLCKRNVT